MFARRNRKDVGFAQLESLGIRQRGRPLQQRVVAGAVAASAPGPTLGARRRAGRPSICATMGENALAPTEQSTSTERLGPVDSLGGFSGRALTVPDMASHLPQGAIETSSSPALGRGSRWMGPEWQESPAAS